MIGVRYVFDLKAFHQDIYIINDFEIAKQWFSKDIFTYRDVNPFIKLHRLDGGEQFFVKYLPQESYDYIKRDVMSNKSSTRIFLIIER